MRFQSINARDPGELAGDSAETRRSELEARVPLAAEWHAARQRRFSGQMSHLEFAGWFGFAASIMAGLCAIVTTVAAMVGYVRWGTPFAAAGIGAGFGCVYAFVSFLPRDGLTRPYVAPAGMARWGRAIGIVLLLAIPSGIVTVGAHVDQSIGPGGCRGFDIDLQGKHMWAPEVPCVEVGTGGVTEPWKVALLGVAREAGDAAGDHLHVCVGLTIPQRTKDGGIPQFLQPAFTLVHENVTRSPVAEIAPGKKGFRCGLRRTVSWPGTVIDVVFQVPTAEQNHRLVISGSPPGVLDLDGLSY